MGVPLIITIQKHANTMFSFPCVMFFTIKKLKENNEQFSRLFYLGNKTKCTLCDFEATSPFFEEAMFSQRLQVIVFPRNMNKFPGGPDHISTFEQPPPTPSINGTIPYMYVIVAP